MNHSVASGRERQDANMSRYFKVPGYMGSYTNVPGYLGGPWEDLVAIITPVTESAIQEGKEMVGDKSGQLVNDLLQSSQFKAVLNTVEQKARKGAEDAIKKDFARLGMFAVAAGAIGGTVLKGTIGNAVAVGLAVYAAWPFVSGGVTGVTSPNKVASPIKRI
jgi:hypothetical protein